MAARTKKTDERHLATNVVVDDEWYGPDYPDNDVTEEVAAKIGPHCWSDYDGNTAEPDDAAGDTEA